MIDRGDGQGLDGEGGGGQGRDDTRLCETEKGGLNGPLLLMKFHQSIMQSINQSQSSSRARALHLSQCQPTFIKFLHYRRQ